MSNGLLACVAAAAALIAGARLSHAQDARGAPAAGSRSAERASRSARVVTGQGEKRKLPTTFGSSR